LNYSRNFGPRRKEKPGGDRDRNIALNYKTLHGPRVGEGHTGGKSAVKETYRKGGDVTKRKEKPVEEGGSHLRKGF